MSMQFDDDVGNPGNAYQNNPPPAVKRAPKRARASPDNIDEEVPDSKRANIQLDPQTKAKVVRFIAISFWRILHIYGATAHSHDLTIGARVASLLTSAHNILREEANDKGSLTEHRVKSHNLLGEANGVVKTMANICDVVAGAATLCDLAYTKPTAADRGHWFETAKLLLSYIVAFRDRITEMHNGGYLVMTERRMAEEMSEFYIGHYGVLPRHGPLCEGLNFKPLLKNSMAQSIGPITQLIMFLRARLDQYAQKWYKVLLRSFAHVTGIDVILTSIRGNTFNAVSPIVTLLGDIALLTGTQNQHRTACFPINAYIYFSGFPTATLIRMGTANEQGVFPNTLPEELPPVTLNFSGKGMWLAYQQIMTMNWWLRGNFTREQAQQVAYHAIFGTYNEDLSLLSLVTNVAKWYTRSELGNCFQQMRTSTNSVVFSLPIQLYMSKLVPAAQITRPVRNTTQLHCVPVFAGYRKQVYLDSFVEALETHTRSNVFQTKELQAVEATLEAIRKHLIAEGERRGSIMDTGTVLWFAADQLELAYTEGGNFQRHTFTTTGKEFFVYK